MNNLTTREELKLLDTNSESDWNRVCDEIKRARNGQYPPDWYQKVILSGMAAMVQINW